MSHLRLFALARLAGFALLLATLSTGAPAQSQADKPAAPNSGIAASAPAPGDAAHRQIGEMVLEGVPEWSPALHDRMLQYLNVRRAVLQDVSDDGGSILITTRFGDAAQLHRLDAPMGMRRQVTFRDEPVSGGGFEPTSKGRVLVYGSDRGGDERTQYYRLNLDNGMTTLLTDGKSRHNSFSMSRDGHYIAFAGTARNDKDFDIYVLDRTQLPWDVEVKLEGGTAGQGAAIQSRASEILEQALASARKLVWQVNGSYSVGNFSPDGSKLLVQQYVSERETHWHVLDPATGDHKEITAGEPAYYDSGVWAHDGSAVYFCSDREGEFRKLYRFDLEWGKWQCLSAEINWDIERVAVDPTGRGLAFVANEDGASRLYFCEETGAGRKAVTGVPQGVIGGLRFARGGGVLGLTIDSALSPADAWTATFPEGRLTRWTQSEIGGLNAAGFVEPQLIRFPSFDQVDGKPREIPAYYYRAPGSGKHPIVIYVHGGPESQFLPVFSSAIQAWIGELGISVIAPNVRGSTGYGRSYHQLDDGVKREDSIRDIGALLDWISKQPELDATRVGIFGGSYGGYMVLGSLTNFPDRFKAGIDVVGIASFISFLEKTPEFRRDLRRAEYGDERDPAVRAVLEKISPLGQAEKIKAALFVLHGRNDPRVPLNEAEQVVAKMRNLRRPVWYAVAQNEGHGFQKKANTDLAAVLYAHFWQQHLLPEAKP